MIICDWDMPEVTGIDLLKRVRGSEKHKHLPFLLLTATREKEKVLNAISAGVNDYLTKPFQTKELKYRVIKLLRKVKTQQKSYYCQHNTGKKKFMSNVKSK